MGGIGPMEIVVVLIIALLILGPKKLPETGKAIGKGIREFKGAVTGHDSDELGEPVKKPVTVKQIEQPAQESAPIVSTASVETVKTAA